MFAGKQRTSTALRWKYQEVRLSQSEGCNYCPKPGDDKTDEARIVAKKTVDHYLALPVSDPDKSEDSFAFWRKHNVTTNKAQKARCQLARVFLTPPPTSTGKSTKDTVKSS